jgi:hypothetical protein
MIITITTTCSIVPNLVGSSSASANMVDKAETFCMRTHVERPDQSVDVANQKSHGTNLSNKHLLI